MGKTSKNMTNEIRFTGSSLVCSKWLLLDCTCIMWFCNAPIRLIVNKILSYTPLTGAGVLITSMIIYAPLLIYIFRFRDIPWKNFHWIFFICAGYFLITLIINPSYSYWYFRSSYGIFDVIFRPDKGAIWGFLIMEIMWCRGRTWKVLKPSLYVVFLYNIFQWVQAQQVGYWEYVNLVGAISKRSYSLEFGYSMAFVLFLAVLFFSREKKRKYIYIAIMAVSLTLMLNSGSRGSLICIFAFIILTIIKGSWSRKQKIFNVATVAFVGSLLILFYNQIVMWMVDLLNRLGLSSRTLLSIVNGQLSDDSGRSDIYQIVWKAIKENPVLGYGAYGDRPLVGPSYNWGYSHSIVLEMMVDFGVILGSIFLILFLYMSLKIILANHDRDKTSIAVLIFSMVTKLFISNTFWGDQYFWMMLALILLESSHVSKIRFRKWLKRGLKKR